MLKLYNKSTYLYIPNIIKFKKEHAGNLRDNGILESLIGHFKDVLYFDYDFRNVSNPIDTI